ncbi:ketopantoate reductase family protein [Planococcus maitriensis]|uniref:2-dehydropantoate 2-reductase n=1 Tax=Planococcus maitriensis TaxID=221799 RepID=A0A365KB21_9BACL|nr:ketopantoate reductase C-terminal domain-containing protein [Planococcus maitriensis]RAZ69990.1 2-dehydropantoate 2-reductase [Planococcus maitriensis]
MKFAIIGGNAQALLLAHLLKKEGEVQLIVMDEEQAADLNAHGLICGTEQQRIAAYTDFEQVDPNAYIFITVHSEELPPTLRLLKIRRPSNPLVFIQQGMLYVEKARLLAHRQIAAGTLDCDAVKVNAHEIKYTKTPQLSFGLLKGEPAHFEPLTKVAQMAVQWTEDIEKRLFEQLLRDSLINPLTAMMKIEKGRLITEPNAYELFRNLYNEMYLAFPEIETLQPIERVAAYCASHPGEISAMLADRMAGDPMDVDGLMLYILQISKLDLPLFKAFYHLLKTVEEN